MMLGCVFVVGFSLGGTNIFLTSTIKDDYIVYNIKLITINSARSLFSNIFFILKIISVPSLYLG